MNCLELCRWHQVPISRSFSTVRRKRYFKIKKESVFSTRLVDSWDFFFRTAKISIPIVQRTVMRNRSAKHFGGWIYCIWRTGGPFFISMLCALVSCLLSPGRLRAWKWITVSRNDYERVWDGLACNDNAEDEEFIQMSETDEETLTAGTY